MSSAFRAAHFRVSNNSQTVKTVNERNSFSPRRKNLFPFSFLMAMGAWGIVKGNGVARGSERNPRDSVSFGTFLVRIQEKYNDACLIRDFDLLHKTNSTVPVYADEFVLFVFGTSSTSVSLSKKSFSTD